jgi:hypothetical protein
MQRTQKYNIPPDGTYELEIIPVSSTDALVRHRLYLLFDLNRAIYMPDPRTNDTWDTTRRLVEIQAVRNAMRNLMVDIRWHTQNCEFEEAAECLWVMIRIGEAYQRGASSLDGLVGRAYEGIGVEELTRCRRDLPRAQIEQLLNLLQHVQRTRTQADIVHQRTAAIADRQHGYSVKAPRIAAEIESLLSGTNPKPRSYDSMRPYNDTLFGLLVTDLALRLYWWDHDEYPAKLTDLVPRYLPEPPRDTFTGQPFIYRRDSGDFLVYSVWQNGVDDGGRFGSRSEAMNLILSNSSPQPAPQLDFDLDTTLR